MFRPLAIPSAKAWGAQTRSPCKSSVCERLFPDVTPSLKRRRNRRVRATRRSTSPFFGVIRPAAAGGRSSPRRLQPLEKVSADMERDYS